MSKLAPQIMVVEDEPLLLEAISDKLTFSHMKPIPCESVQKAIYHLQTATELPDAVWLDYYLKELNGLDLVKQLKENDKWKEIPVLVVSNSADPEKVKEILSVGANKYVLKAEHRLDEIVEMIRNMI